MLIKPVAKQHGLSPNLWRQTPNGIDVLLFHHENQIVLSTHGCRQLLSFMSVQRKAMRPSNIAGMNISRFIYQSAQTRRCYLFMW